MFWLPASLASRFQVKTRRANALIYEYKTVAEQSISLKTRRKTEFKHNHLWLISNERVECKRYKAAPPSVAGILRVAQNDRLFDYCHVVNSELNNLLARII